MLAFRDGEDTQAQEGREPVGRRDSRSGNWGATIHDGKGREDQAQGSVTTRCSN